MVLKSCGCEIVSIKHPGAVVQGYCRPVKGLRELQSSLSSSGCCSRQKLLQEFILAGLVPAITVTPAVTQSHLMKTAALGWATPLLR